ncbi:MAG: ribosome-binding factor A [Mariprofundaceae bacterium]
MRHRSPNQSRLQADIYRLLTQLMQREISDPRLADINITRVESTPSGHGMIIWIHRLEVKDAEECERGLNKLAPHFMHLLRHSLPKQRLPKIQFRWDIALEKGDKVLSLLHDLNRAQSP